MDQVGSPLAVVGSVAFDTIETAAARKERLLGGSASYFSIAASFFCPVRLVAVVGQDFPAEYTQLLQKHGVDLKGFKQLPGKTFHWSGQYSDDLRTRTTLETELNVFSDFRPQLPILWRSSEYLFLGNIHPSLQREVLDQVPHTKLVALDTMNYWIEKERAALVQVLGKIDILIINDEEAFQLTEQANIARAGKEILRLGPKAVVIKRGDAGAFLFHREGIFAAPAFPLEEVVDPTGAGDSFAGGFMGYLAQKNDTSPAAIRRAMFYGSTMASFSVESFSIDRLTKLSQSDIAERYGAFCAMTHLDDIKL